MANAFEKILLKPGRSKAACPIMTVNSNTIDDVAMTFGDVGRNWLKAHGFKAGKGKWIVVPDASGKPQAVLFGLGDATKSANPFIMSPLARALPEGDYRLADVSLDHRLVCVGWLLQAYSFDRYLKPKSQPARLVCPENVDRGNVLSMADAVALTRDLINTPTEDMGPDELEASARKLATATKAKVKVTSGTALQTGFPMIHAVGRASHRPPRLIDMNWGAAKDPKVTLVGKGVCFDTGGLDIKPASSMLLMKKDMGGAANVLGLATMIMAAKLKVRLRVLIPAVENAIAGDAFRPGDVLTSRSGKTVEIGNTDAEGRLVLADALTLADAEKPDLLIDMATLTGAARVALGPEVAPFFTDDDTAAERFAQCSKNENDPVWRLPFWEGYEDMLSSKIADMNNVGGGGFAGSITAGLFLRRFVQNASTYMHFDVFGWTPAARPAAPFGGQAHAIRALFAYIRDRYGA